jgi:Zn-dependent protease with chaperone function
MNKVKVLVNQRIFPILGISNSSVNVLHIDQLIACAAGVNPAGFLSLPLSGAIFINLQYLKMNHFSDAEILFILSHECAHIFKNHFMSKVG